LVENTDFQHEGSKAANKQQNKKQSPFLELQKGAL
jgi:hypothetical protein